MAEIREGSAPNFAPPDLDEEGQPCEFELLDDEEIAAQIYDEFREATKDLYDFE